MAMWHIITLLIIFILLVCAVLILFTKVNYFRQQSKKLRNREYEFIYELAAEGKLKPDQAFKMDDFIESRMTDVAASEIKKTDDEPGINELRSLISERIHGLSGEKMQQLLKYLDEEQTPDQRRYDRREFFKIIDYAVGDRFYRDIIKNISAGGVFIETAETFSEGRKILMTFMPPDHQRPFKISGEIIRIDPDGIGVTFKIKSQVQEMVLNSFIEKMQYS
jgi:Tfp pilus assembly protein PilZ